MSQFDAGGGSIAAEESLIVFRDLKWQEGFTRLFVLLPHDYAEAYCVAQIEIISRYIGSSLRPILLNKKDGTTKRQQREKVPYASYVIYRQSRTKKRSHFFCSIHLDLIHFSKGLHSLGNTLHSI